MTIEDIGSKTMFGIANMVQKRKREAFLDFLEACAAAWSRLVYKVTRKLAVNSLSVQINILPLVRIVILNKKYLHCKSRNHWFTWFQLSIPPRQDLNPHGVTLQQIFESASSLPFRRRRIG